MSKNQGSVPNKRQCIRYPAHRSSILKRKNDRFYTTIVNFSESGIGFLSGQPLETNEQVELIFEVDIEGKNIDYHLPLKIVRVKEDHDGFEYCMGALVNEVTPEYTLLLAKLEEMHKNLNPQAITDDSI